MEEVTSQIYVRFVDGVNVNIPVQARLTSNNNYLLLPDSEFDYDDDAVLFEFGIHDVVSVIEIELENGSFAQLASHLIKAGDSRNLQKRLLFQIALHQPKPTTIFEGIGQNEIRSLYRKIEGASFAYPTIQAWFIKNKDEVQRMIE